MTAPDVHSAIEAVWRIDSAKIIAVLARMVRDVGIAEELAQDALVAALQHWPQSGIPNRRGAWLMATARHRAIDMLRRRKRLEQKHEELGRERRTEEEMAAVDFDGGPDDDIGDDLLRLMFMCCHPVLSSEARVALTLRLLGGLATDEIARAFLVPEPTIAQNGCPDDLQDLAGQLQKEFRHLAGSQPKLRGCIRQSELPFYVP